MRRFADHYISFMDKINKVLKWLLALMLAVTFATLCLQVFSRFVFQIPVTWTEELSRYLMIWIAFIGASLAVRHQQLIRIEVILSFLPRGMQVAVQLAAALVTLVFCAVVFYYGLELIEVVKIQTSPALHVPMSIPYSAIPVGCLLIFFNTVAGFLGSLKGENQ